MYIPITNIMLYFFQEDIQAADLHTLSYQQCNYMGINISN
jgi:hypothetical protein